MYLKFEVKCRKLVQQSNPNSEPDRVSLESYTSRLGFFYHVVIIFSTRLQHRRYWMCSHEPWNIIWNIPVILIYKLGIYKPSFSSLDQYFGFIFTIMSSSGSSYSELMVRVGDAARGRRGENISPTPLHVVHWYETTG